MLGMKAITCNHNGIAKSAEKLIQSLHITDMQNEPILQFPNSGLFVIKNNKILID